MHIKFIKTGGTIRDAINYLLREKDHQKKRRPVVQVMRGDPEQIKALGRAIENDPKRKSSSYASAVISWAPEDRPTPKEKKKVVDYFIKVAAAGIENDVASLAVDHGDHVHVIFIKQNLRTGHAWNPAAPGWQKWTDPVRDRWNEAKGWKSPDIDAHPENVRVVNLAAHNLPKKVADAKREITRRAMRAIGDGIITDRASMIAWLKRGGAEITRESERSISVRVPEHKKPLKMEGVIYERGFRPERVRETLRRAREARERVDRETREKKLAKLTEAVKSIYSSRAKYHRKRFASKKVGSGRRREQSRAPEPKPNAAHGEEAEPLWLAVLDWDIPAPSPVAGNPLAVAGWSVQRPAGQIEDRQRVVSGERDPEKLLEGVTNDRVRATLERSERAIVSSERAISRADRRDDERERERSRELHNEIRSNLSRYIEHQTEIEEERSFEDFASTVKQLASAVDKIRERAKRVVRNVQTMISKASDKAQKIVNQIASKAAQIYKFEGGVADVAEAMNYTVDRKANVVKFRIDNVDFESSIDEIEKIAKRERVINRYSNSRSELKRKKIKKIEGLSR